MKKTDWAIRDQKLQMLDAVKRAQDKYAFLDDYRYALEKDLPTVEAAIRKYGDELRRPLTVSLPAIFSKMSTNCT
jgi:hypothetical protein